MIGIQQIINFFFLKGLAFTELQVTEMNSYARGGE